MAKQSFETIEKKRGLFAQRVLTLVLVFVGLFTLTYIVGHLETGRISGGEFGKVFLKTFGNGMTLIDIDTGWQYGEEGVLTCICLDDGRFYSISKKDMR